jgi:hypothetical protein
MSKDHFIEYYACGKHVRQQCRCPAQEKRCTLSSEPCPVCKPGNIRCTKCGVQEGEPHLDFCSLFDPD